MGFEYLKWSTVAILQIIKQNYEYWSEMVINAKNGFENLRNKI